MFSHDTSGGYFKDAADTMSKNPDDENARLFSILDQLESLSTSLGVFRLRQCYPQHEGPKCNEWVQSSNPAKEPVVTGFKAINWVRTKNSQDKPFKGLGRNEKYEDTLMDDVPKHFDGKCFCFHSIGHNKPVEKWKGTAYESSIHGYNDGDDNVRKVRKVELYIAVARGWVPCSVPAVCKKGEMCDSRPGRSQCNSIPAACPTNPLLVADSYEGCLCSAAAAICEKGQRCDLDGKVCSPLAECPAPEGRPKMAVAHPTQESFETEPVDGWDDMKLTLPEIPILIKNQAGAVVAIMNDSKILNSSRREYIGEVDIANEEILRHGVLFGRLERWSNGYMVIANGSVVGRLEERFVEGMNSTFQCFHHHFVVGRVS